MVLIGVQLKLPFLSPALGSHMVLQRGRPNTFWGWTKPGERVTVSVAGRQSVGLAETSGKWTVRFTPPNAGGPYTLEIDGSQHVELTDVLVGDVWLCAGQSNMEMGISLAKDAATEIPSATAVQMRIYTVPTKESPTPLRVNGGTWKNATPETLTEGGWGGFSAVGYFFGKALRRELGVPIGLVQIAVGGTDAELWTSREAFVSLKGDDEIVRQIDAAQSGIFEDDPGERRGWAAVDFRDSNWPTVPFGGSFSALKLDNFDGAAWLRREVTLTEAQAKVGATLSLGSIDDEDVTWINGVKVGSTKGYNVPRSYAVPPGTLRSGRNLLAVKVIDNGGTGGPSGPVESVLLTLVDGTKIPLNEGWRGHVGAAIPNARVPSSLFNGMVAPEAPLAVKGAIWYQGENNANRAAEYESLLTAMIGGWRVQFGQGDFPFELVSLAAYQPPNDTPEGDSWAELRGAQSAVARKIKNGGLALALDVGEAEDIHPKNKRTVGERLALVALAKTYGRHVPYQGPTFRRLTLAGSAARVAFEHTEGGLIARGGSPREFWIMGADRKWWSATARIEGPIIVLTSPRVAKPVAVRYAWESNPSPNLYNGAGLPAVPFRTDGRR